MFVDIVQKTACNMCQSNSPQHIEPAVHHISKLNWMLQISYMHTAQIVISD